MMTYRRDSRSSRLPYIVGIIFIALFIAFWSSVRNMTTTLVEWSGLAHTRLYVYGSGIASRVNLYASSNNALYNELRSTQELLRIEQEKYTRLIVAEDTLRIYEKYATSSARTVFAKRIGNIDGYASESFRINVGQESRCQEGDMVVNENNIFIGKISNTDRYTSRVSLAWSGEPVMAKTVTSNELLSLSGQRNGTYEIRAPRTVTLKKGDVFVLDIDPTIIVAEVMTIDENEGEPYMLVTAAIPFSPQSITHVAVRCQVL